jgi:hypothetical protein
MDVRAALKTQYHAALAMLRQAIEECPDDLWDCDDGTPRFWRVAYHALFFTHMYLQRNRKAFRAWEHHRDECQALGSPRQPAEAMPPYTKAQVLDYWQLCDAMVDGDVDRMDLDAPECGFSWYNLPKLDHQINNIRHVQHHTALLAGRLRSARGIDVKWVGPF